MPTVAITKKDTSRIDIIFFIFPPKSFGNLIQRLLNAMHVTAETILPV
jgi:hypothetical protein